MAARRSGGGRSRAPVRAPKLGQLARTRAAALEGAKKILLRDGFGALGIEQVVAESGVSRASIYRHFGDADQLALEAFDSLLGEPPPHPNRGNLRDDLVANFSSFVRALTRSRWGRVIPALIEASLHDRAFERVLREITRQRRVVTAEILQSAVDRGEIPVGTDFDRFLDKITGPLYYRFLISGQPIGEEGYVEHLVDSAIAAAHAVAPGATGTS